MRHGGGKQEVAAAEAKAADRGEAVSADAANVSEGGVAAGTDVDKPLPVSKETENDVAVTEVLLPPAAKRNGLRC